jgi:hypothetical protein
MSQLVETVHGGLGDLDIVSIVTATHPHAADGTSFHDQRITPRDEEVLCVGVEGSPQDLVLLEPAF